MSRKALIILISSIAGFLAVVGAVIGIVIAVNSGSKTESYRTIKLFDYVGEVYIERNENEFQVESPGLNLKSGDTLKVKKNAKASLKLDEDKYISVMENTTIHLTASGEKGNTRTSIFVEEGGVIGDIQSKLSESEQFDITTANSVMAIRGTAFLVQVTETATTKEITFGLYRGETEVNVLQKNSDGNYINTKLTQNKDDKYTIIINKSEELSKDEMTSINEAVVQGESDLINLIECENNTEKANEQLNNIVINGLELTKDEKASIIETIEEIKEKAQELIKDENEKIDTLVVNSYYGVYDGASHTISAIAPETYTIKYSTDNVTFNLDEAPSYSNVGFYTIYVLFTKGEEQYHAYGTVDISKANITFNGRVGSANTSTGLKLSEIDCPTLDIPDATFTWENPDYEIVQGQNKVNIVVKKDNYNDLIVEYTYIGISEFVYTASRETDADFKYVYDGTQRTGKVNVDGNPSIRYSGTYESLEGIDPTSIAYYDDIPTSSTVGKYYFYFEISGENFTTVTDYAYFEITKAQITYSAPDVTTTYTGAQQFITVNTISGLKILYWNEENETFNLAISPRHNEAGVYTIKFIIYDQYDNYEEVEGSATLTINPATFSVTDSTHPVYYDGQPHTVELSASESSVTYKYGLIEGTYDLDEAPTFTRPGTYKVYVEASKANFVTVTREVMVVISELEIIQYSSSLENSQANTFTYDGTPKTGTLTVTTPGVTVEYADVVTQWNGSYSTLEFNNTVQPTAVDADNYYIPFKLTKENYEPAYSYIWFRIDTADIEFTAENVTVVYDGQPHGIEVTVDEMFDAKFYDNTWMQYILDESPTFTEVGTYPVRLRVRHETLNYNVYNLDLTVTIKPAYIDLSGVNFQTELAYTGEDIDITPEDIHIVDSMGEPLYVMFTITDINYTGTIHNAGSYDVTLALQANSNYTFNSDNSANLSKDLTVAIVIAKADIEVDDGELTEFEEMSYSQVYDGETLEELEDIFDYLSAVSDLGGEAGHLEFAESQTFEIGKNAIELTFIPDDSTNYNDYVFTGYIYVTGLGTAASPINVYSVDTWNQLNSLVQDNPESYLYVIQSNDIDFTDDTFTPIDSFIGSYDAQNHYIKVNMNTEDEVLSTYGLFKSIYGLEIPEEVYDSEDSSMYMYYDPDSTIDEEASIIYVKLSRIANLKVIDSAAHACGQEFGFVAGSASDTVFDNITIKDSTIDTINTLNDEEVRATAIGGVVGLGYDIFFTYCTVDNLTIDNITANNVGGILGVGTITQFTNNNVSNSVINNPRFSSSVDQGTGGLIGALSLCMNATITDNSVENTNITGNNSVGGAIGNLKNIGYISSVDEGIVTATEYITISNFSIDTVTITNKGNETGGIIGTANHLRLDGSTVEDVTINGIASAGGILGAGNNTIIENANASGLTYNSIIGPDATYNNYGGIIGNQVDSVIIDTCSVNGMVITDIDCGMKNIGGLIGYLYVSDMTESVVQITDNTVSGLDITAYEYIAGLIGNANMLCEDVTPEDYFPTIENNEFKDSVITFGYACDLFLNFETDDETNIFYAEYNCDSDNSYSNVTLMVDKLLLDYPPATNIFAYNGTDQLQDFDFYNRIIEASCLGEIAGTFTITEAATATLDYGDNIIHIVFTPNDSKYSVVNAEMKLKVFTDGSEETPFDVYDEEAFNALEDFITYMEERGVDYVYVEQSADLDFQDISICSVNTFVGSYDGKNHTISNIDYSMFINISGILYEDTHVENPDDEYTRAYTLYSAYVPQEDNEYIYMDIRYSFVKNIQINGVFYEMQEEGSSFGFLANNIDYACISGIAIEDATITAKHIEDGETVYSPYNDIGLLAGTINYSIVDNIDIANAKMDVSATKVGGMIGNVMSTDISNVTVSEISIYNDSNENACTGGVAGSFRINNIDILLIGTHGMTNVKVLGTEEAPSRIDGITNVGGIVGFATTNGKAAETYEDLSDVDAPTLYASNLQVDYVDVVADLYAGGVFGNITSSQITGVEVTNTTVTANCIAGGVAGIGQDGTMTFDSTKPIQVTLILSPDDSQDEPGCFGGIVGLTNSLTINDATINMELILEETDQQTVMSEFGGIAGSCSYSSINNCYVDTFDISEYGQNTIIAEGTISELYGSTNSVETPPTISNSTYNPSITFPAGLIQNVG